jgi:4-diphosphocytidyl-2-C-methyl-D-erythritol kinase
MSRARAHAKINLALVVGPTREDGMHEVATVLQRVDLHDDVSLESSQALSVDGFVDDTLVRTALAALAERAGVEPLWRATIEKRIPVAAGLAGGSSDAAAALGLANEMLETPLSLEQLHVVAGGIGADVPFFLREGTQLATGDGTELERLALPLDYHVLLLAPHGEAKASTAAVYGAFDDRQGSDGFAHRRVLLDSSLARVAAARDLAALPRNDLATSPLSERLEDLGAFRADVSGAGPTLYGLFDDERAAKRARDELSRLGRTWLTRPV